MRASLACAWYAYGRAWIERCRSRAGLLYARLQLKADTIPISLMVMIINIINCVISLRLLIVSCCE